MSKLELVKQGQAQLEALGITAYDIVLQEELDDQVSSFWDALSDKIIPIETTFLEYLHNYADFGDLVASYWDDLEELYLDNISA